VKLNELLTEGMIRLRDLEDDYYIYSMLKIAEE